MNKLQTDRRQRQVDVEHDRRTDTVEQRLTPRFVLDKNISNDVINIKNSLGATNNNKAVEFVGDLFPSSRRILSVENNKDDRIKAYGLGLVGLINLKEDIRDILSIIGLTKSEAPKGYYSRFKFFAGTLVENKLKKSEWGRRVLLYFDSSLADTYLGEQLDSYFKITPDIQTFKKEIRYPFLKKEILQREYVQLDGKLIPNILSLTTHRITKIGVGVGLILEVPAILNSIHNKKDSGQLQRSIFNVTSCSVLGALTSSALTVLTGSPAGSVMGLGIGIFIANQLTKCIYNNKTN